MKTNLNIDIDFALLRKQKLSLLNHIETLKKDNDSTRDFDGIIHLIDGIQDNSVENGIDEKIVFEN